MILDTSLIFSDAQAITATAASTNVIDFGATGTPYGAPAALKRDLGKGDEIPVLIQIVEDFNNLTSLTVAFEMADDAGFSTNKRAVWSRTYALADLVAGKNVNMDDFEPGSDQRYGRMYYTVTGTAPTTGKITAAVVGGLQTSGVAY